MSQVSACWRSRAAATTRTQGLFVAHKKVTYLPRVAHVLPLPSALILVFRATISVPRAVVKAALAVTFRTNGADAGSESVTVATDEVQPTHASTSTTNDTAFMLLLPCGDGGTNLSGTAASCRARSNCDPTDVSTTFSTATSSMQLCVSTILTRYILCHSMLAVRVGSPLKKKKKEKEKEKEKQSFQTCQGYKHEHRCVYFRCQHYF